MLNGKLKINDDKNEFLIIGPSQQLGKVFQILSLCAGLVAIIPKSALKFARAHTKVGFPTEYLLEVEKALRITIHGLDDCKEICQHGMQTKLRTKLYKFSASSLIVAP